MKVIEFGGLEMEKETKTSFQDYFNESFITLMDEGKVYTLSIVYLRYFEEHIGEYTPFQKNPICEISGHRFYLRDILAVIVQLQNKNFAGRKRIFISDGEEFKQLFAKITENDVHQWLLKNENWKKLHSVQNS